MSPGATAQRPLMSTRGDCTEHGGHNEDCVCLCVHSERRRRSSLEVREGQGVTPGSGPATRSCAGTVPSGTARMGGVLSVTPARP